MVGEQSSDRNADSLVVRSEDYLSTTLDGEAVLLDSDSGVYYGMNETGTILWDELESPQNIAALQELLVDEFDVDEDEAVADVRAFLNDLQESGLVEVRSADDAT